MRRAGFVLVGGGSTRMGRDKALLPYQGGMLVEHVARLVRQAAGSATLVGAPETYRALGWPVLADLHPGLGPLAGIETALRATQADWNLVVACDMPALSGEFLGSLLDAAEADDAADCLLPRHGAGWLEPLCAVYHRRCLPVISAGLEQGTRKITDALAGLRVVERGVPDSGQLVNANTPADWARHLERAHG